MKLLDDDSVRAFIGEELEPARAWAAMYGISLDWVDAALRLSLRLQGASESEGVLEDYLIVGLFEEYRVMPPTWRFLDPRDEGLIGVSAYPLGGLTTGSVLHGNGLICAPWSRDSYAERSGPHGDWTDATQWETVGMEYTQAHTIAEMLSRIHVEVQTSPKRMSPLPELPEMAA